MSKYDMASINGLVYKLREELLDIEMSETKKEETDSIMKEMLKRLKNQDDMLHDIAQDIENVRGEIWHLNNVEKRKRICDLKKFKRWIDIERNNIKTISNRKRI